MEGATAAVPAVTAGGVEDKGLKRNALGFVSSVVIGVASTAPGYSLAASLGFIAAVGGVGLQSPAILLLAFIPMVLIAASYYYMNRADPDCGTTFAWVTKAMGPWIGWIGGWAIVVADIIVMANLAQIAGKYTFLLFDWNSAANSTAAVTAVGVAWIAVMTAICYIGIELSARTQVVLLSFEIVTLAVFAIVALIKVATDSAAAGAIDPSVSWINPFQISSFDALVNGILIAIFIYWGWDSTVTVNEETEHSTRTPGKAAILATILLLLIYVVVAVAAQAYGGVEPLVKNQDDVLSFLGGEVFASPWDKILIIAVLTSAAASTQTTILPTARTTLSMARAGAMPRELGHVSTRYLTPTTSTVLMGTFSILWYVGLTIVSENILFDSISALGLMIAFYYGLTGYACVIYYRRELVRSVKSFLLIGVAPLVGAIILTAVFIKSLVDLWNPENSASGDAWFGVGPPFIIGLGFLVFGAILMVIWSAAGHRDFFRRRPETVPPEVLTEAGPAARDPRRLP